jgi:uncharacterized RDD family membrane protein YckC
VAVARLIVNPTSSSRREISLPRTLLSIGRDPSNDVVLPDAMVSRRHAVIECRGSQYYLRDCNSSNGSLVNGDRVSERSLRDGDLVAIGTARLLFREEVAAEELGAKVLPHPSAPRLRCPSCDAEHRKGDLFCRQCGAQLAADVPPRAVCTACGTSVLLPARFCNACGSSLARDEAPAEAAQPEPPAPGEAFEGATGPAGPTEEARRPEPFASAGTQVQPAAEPEPPPREALRASRSSAAVEPAPTPLRMAPPPRPRPAAPPARAWLGSSSWPRARTGAAPAPERASFGRRLAAGLLDTALVGAGQLVLLAPLAWYWWSQKLDGVRFAPVLVSVVVVVLLLVLGAAYYVYGWGVRGATPGKQMLEIAVEAEDGAFPIGVPRALGRLLACLLSGATLGAGFLMIAFTGDALHDRIAGTRVVRRERP